MKGIVLFFFVGFICLMSNGQNTYLDSLKTQLENHPAPKAYLYNLLETEKHIYRKAVICNKIGLTYQYESNLDSADYFHKKALV